MESEYQVEDRRNFTELLNAYFGRSGSTQQELASKVGVHRNTLNKWLGGSRPEFRGQVLRLADELYIDTQEERKAFIQAAGFPVERWPTEVWTVPQQDMFFTGRDDVLLVLQKLLVSGTTASTQAISGLGGIGKTHLAIEYAYRFHEYYESVLWLQADSWETLASACTRLAKELGLPEQKGTDTKPNIKLAEKWEHPEQKSRTPEKKETTDPVVATVQQWLRKHHHWLLILDNVENHQEILLKFVPTHHQGSVLITTRVQNVEPLAQTLALATMSEQEGVLFLLRRTKKIAPKATFEKVSPDRYDESKKIWQLMDGLSLALDQAGAYILETGCSFSSYREQYTRRRTELLQRRGKRVISHEESVTTTFSLAFGRVEASTPMAADILRVCALLHNEAIPEKFFEIGAQYLGPHFVAVKEHWDLAIEALLDYSLLQRHTEMRTLSLHRLVQAVLIDIMDEQAQRQWAEKTVQVVNHLFPTIDGIQRQPAQQYILHAQACAKLIDLWNMEHVEAARLLHEAGTYFSMVAQYEQAELLLKRGLEIRERLLGSEHFAVAASLNNLGWNYQLQGKYGQAELALMGALKIVEQVEGPEGSHVSSTLNCLAAVYKAGQNYAS
jgi:transcriptional regulator with XRE-family HTH domain